MNEEIRLEEKIDRDAQHIGFVILTIVVALVGGFIVGRSWGTKTSPQEIPNTQLDPIAALQDQVAQLQTYANEAGKAIAEVATRLDSIAGNHNKLVEAVQRVESRSDYQDNLIGRTLRNKYGKEKWTTMLKEADAEFIAEMEQAKKAAAEKAAKTEVKK